MKFAHKLNPVARATGVIGVTAALVTGITFAALSSTATLTNNTIASASAGLEVDNTDSGASTFPQITDTGYTFTGVVPGGADSNVGNFQLKNTGTTVLDVAAGLDGSPNWTVVPSGTVDDTKVQVTFTCFDTDDASYGVTASVSDLVAGPVAFTGGSLGMGDTATCTVSVSMDADAFTGSSASSDEFDFVFTGTGV